MKKQKRILSIICAVALLAITGCGKPATNNDDGSISGKVVYSSHRTDFTNTIFKDYAKEFNDKHPGLEFTIDTYQDYEQTIKIKASSNDLPDVYSAFSSQFTPEQFVQFNIPLEYDYVSDFEGLEEFTGSDGKLYGLSQGKEIGGLVAYNKKIFAELGIEIPKTLDEFIEAAKKIKASSSYVPLASIAKAQWPLMVYEVYVPIYLEGDADVFNKYLDPENNAPFTMDGPWGKSFELCDMIIKSEIYENDPLSADWEPFKRDFRSGKIAMFFGSEASTVTQLTSDTLETKDIGLFPFPYNNNPEVRYAVNSYPTGIFLAKNTKNLDAAKAVFDFIANEKYEDYTRQAGLLSSRKSVVLSYDHMSEFENFTNIKFLDSQKTSSEVKSVLNKGQINFTAKIQELFTGKTPNDIIDDLNKSWETGLK